MKKGSVAVLLVAGIALGFLAGRRVAPPAPALHLEGTVQAVTSDGDAFAFTERDGTTASFELGRPDGAELIRPGAHLALTVIDVAGSTRLLEVRSAP